MPRPSIVTHGWDPNMCGRFTLNKNRNRIVDDFGVEEWDAAAEVRPRFNVAPTQSSLVLMRSTEHPGPHRAVREMRWGLIPHWAKDPTIASKLINARGETLTEKPSFRNLVGSRRCAVLTDGFFEWKKNGDANVPHYVRDPEGAMLPMAGLWDLWKDPANGPLETFTIVTTEARADLAWLHHRMPVILPPQGLGRWLDVDGVLKSDALAELKPYAGALETYPVSKLVNSPRFDSPEVIRRAEPELPVQSSLF